MEISLKCNKFSVGCGVFWLCGFEIALEVFRDFREFREVREVREVSASMLFP